MSNLVRPMSNPFGAGGDAYGQKWPSLAEYDPFWGLWGPPAPLIGGPEGPNRSPWMCLTMSNHVQSMFSPGRVARTSIRGSTILGDFWSLQAPFRDPQWPKKGSQTQKRWAHQLTIITKAIIIPKKVLLVKTKKILIPWRFCSLAHCGSVELFLRTKAFSFSFD